MSAMSSTSESKGYKLDLYFEEKNLILLSLAGHPKQEITEGGVPMLRSSCRLVSHMPVEPQNSKDPLSLHLLPLEVWIP